jgi:hypothetical protein
VTTGEALTKAVLADLPEGWELDRREIEFLDLAARQADDLAQLEKAIAKEGVTALGSTGQRTVHPAVLEARQARLAISRLLGAIELPDAEGQPATAASVRARTAANARWARRERVETMNS